MEDEILIPLGILTYVFFCLAFLFNIDLSYFERLIYMGFISLLTFIIYYNKR